MGSTAVKWTNRPRRTRNDEAKNREETGNAEIERV